MSLLKKVLWQRRSGWQIAGASMGVFVGLFLLLLAMQFYLDIQAIMRGARDENILVINKPMGFANTLGAPNQFTPEELAEIKSQRFFKDVGTFTSNRFQVSAVANTLGFRTELFFQSVPNRFLDIDTANFKWGGGENPIPIVLSSDYLALYNFGFAPSQSLPPFTVETIKQVTFDVVVRGKGAMKVYQGRVFALTRNVNSILVPSDFMEFANAQYGDQPKSPTAQLIATTDNPYDKALNDFLTKKGYELSRGGLIGGELKTTLNLLILLVVVIGAIIIGLSLLVFVLNFQLLVAQSSADIKLLIQIGYNDWSIARLLSRNLVALFGGVSVAAFAAVAAVKWLFASRLIAQGYDFLSLWLDV